MNLLNGFKTILGLAISVVGVVFHKDITALSPIGDGLVALLGNVLLVVGLVHKVLKGDGTAAVTGTGTPVVGPSSASVANPTAAATIALDGAPKAVPTPFR